MSLLVLSTRQIDLPLLVIRMGLESYACILCGIDIEKYYQVGTISYVTGLQLISHDDQTWVGYRAPGILIHTMDAMTFEEFMVAVGSQGIRALQIVTADGPSRWLGCPKNVAQTQRLMIEGHISVLKCAFDVRSCS